MNILGGFDLVVTCHEPYREKYLPECLGAWDNEDVVGKKILVLDSCEGSLTRNRWDVVSVKLKNPGKSRNAGLARCSSKWVVHWDADNIPRPGLANEFRNAILKAKKYVAYIGPGVPDNPFDDYGVDTNAAWNRQAILSVGGWQDTSLEDWRLGWTLHRMNYKLERMVGEQIALRHHPARRSYASSESDKLWSARDFDLVSLQRGDELLSRRWLEALERVQLPPNLRITLVVDGIQKNIFADDLLAKVRAICPGDVQMILTDQQSLPAPRDRSEAELRVSRYRRVFDLYRRAFAATSAPWVYTWEDDVIPDDSDVLVELSGKLRPGPSCRVGATSAIYPERYSLDYVCAGAGPDAATWRGNLPLAETLGPLAVGAIPAGLALWRRSDYDALPDDSGNCFDLGMSRVVHARGSQPWLVARRADHLV